MWVIRANKPGQSPGDIMKAPGLLSSQLRTIYRSRFHLFAKIVYTWIGFRGRYTMLMMEEE